MGLHVEHVFEEQHDILAWTRLLCSPPHSRANWSKGFPQSLEAFKVAQEEPNDDDSDSSNQGPQNFESEMKKKRVKFASDIGGDLVYFKTLLRIPNEDIEVESLLVKMSIGCSLVFAGFEQF